MKVLRYGFLAGLAVLLLCPNLTAGSTPDETSLDVSHTGKILIEEDHKVGSEVLKAGVYKVEHLSEESGHFVRFTPKSNRGIPVLTPVQCVLEPGGEALTFNARTVGDDAGMKRILTIKVKGNNAAYSFRE